jgi:hypothetical protein
MKKFLTVILLLTLFFLFSGYRNSSPKIVISDLEKKGDIRSGRFKYRIYFLGILPIGEAVLEEPKIEEYNGQRVYHLTASTQNLKIFSKIFSGQAVLDSYIDIQQLNPILFKQKMIIGRVQTIERDVFYDQKNNIMAIDGVRRSIFPDTQDPLSAIFRLMHMDFGKNREIEMGINTNQKNYILKGTAISREVLINKKIYGIVLAKGQVKRRDKNPYHKSNISVTFLKGKVNLPVLIRVFATGILINARLTEIE